MKSKSLEPYVEQLINATVTLVGLPFIVFAIGMIKININNTLGGFTVLIIILLLLMYAHYLTKYIVPGIFVIFEIKKDSFETKKMKYICCYIQNESIYINNEDVKIDNKIFKASYCNSTKLLQFNTVILSDNNGKVAFSTTYRHEMKKGNEYTIQYGKISKTIVSILSEDGEQMLKFDIESIFPKRKNNKMKNIKY